MRKLRVARGALSAGNAFPGLPVPVFMVTSRVTASSVCLKGESAAAPRLALACHEFLTRSSIELVMLFLQECRWTGTCSRLASSIILAKCTAHRRIDGVLLETAAPLTVDIVAPASTWALSSCTITQQSPRSARNLLARGSVLISDPMQPFHGVLLF